MPKSVTCPACATAFRLARNLCGREMYCPECGTPMVVTRGGSALPLETNPTAVVAPKSTRAWTPVVLAMAAVLMVGTLAVATTGVVGGGIALAYFGLSHDEPKPAPAAPVQIGGGAARRTRPCRGARGPSRA
jgi:hypothetical protein